jgi:hypothetical protein
MKRLLFGIIALVSVSSVLAIPSVALAGKPLKEFAPAPTVTVEDVCDFPVLLDPIINQEYIKTFFDKEGDFDRQTVTGRFVVELTNLDSGESMTVNVSGPVFFTLSGNTLTVRLTGRSLLFFFPGELTTGPAYVRVTNGPNILDVDLTTGAVTPRRESGNFVDVCEALAE